MSPERLSALQRSAVALNKKGLISLNQIEGGKDFENTFNDIKNQISQLNPDDFRKVTDYIMTQDLDPEVRQKMFMLIEKYDMLMDVLNGFEYNDHVYELSDILMTVLQNMNDWSDDKCTVVKRI